MPLSTLDPRPALVVIDMQKGILQMPAAHPVIKIVQQAASLTEAFRRRRLPVVLVTVTGAPPGRTDAPQGNFTPPPDRADLAGELGAHPDDHTITKQRWGAFTGTSLHDHLQSRDVTQVVLTGIATSIGVESTARCARLGETATTSEILAMLDTRQLRPIRSLP